MKGSLIVVGFFVLGVCLGRLDLAPALLMDSRVTFAALCCLLFCVGMSIGSNDNIRERVPIAESTIGTVARGDDIGQLCW